MAQELPWRGAAIHGFDSPDALEYSLDKAGARFASAEEICGKLMNGARYANPHPPADSDDHQDFEHHVVVNQGYLDMRINAQANAQGWLFYTEDHNARTKEKRATDLKISDEIHLPTYEINAGSYRLRRRVTLPPSLIEDGEPVYHFIQYKIAPIIGGPARASLLAGLAHGDRLQDAAIDARAAKFAAIAASMGEDMGPEEWAIHLSNLSAQENVARFEAFINDYKSSDDDDYAPRSEDEAVLETDALYDLEALDDGEDGLGGGEEGLGGEDAGEDAPAN